jgi:hypothetical protein
MDIKIVDNEGKEIIKENKPLVSENNVSAPVLPELEHKAIGQVLGLENESDLAKYEDKLNTLLDYAKSQSDDHSFENLKWIIRELGSKVNTPPFGEDRVNYIARYAYLLTEAKGIKSELEKFEK